MNPTIITDLKKLSHNARFLADLCHKNGISLTAVTKVFCADPAMVSVLSELPIDFLADSRLENITTYPKDIGQKTILLRLPSPSQAEEVVNNCNISLNSEMLTVQALAQAAEKNCKTHGVVIMIDLGDLREGIYHNETKKILDICGYALSQKSLTLEGIGTNLTCYGSVLPTQKNLNNLCQIASQIEQKYKIKLPMISGGNSSSLNMLASGQIPKAVNNLRLGEAIVCGLETAMGKPFAGLYQNVVILEAAIIEIAKKPSMPEGEININAFGEKMTYTDKGPQIRAILAIGRQDTYYEGLKPLTPGAEIIGASSDHLIVDITNVKTPLTIGGTLTFSLSYGAVLAGFSSKYVNRTYTN
jgi:predicted amino acid racemase